MFDEVFCDEFQCSIYFRQHQSFLNSLCNIGCAFHSNSKYLYIQRRPANDENLKKKIIRCFATLYIVHLHLPEIYILLLFVSNILL